MKPETRARFQLAAALWVREAMAVIAQHPEQNAALEACLVADREVCVVWHIGSKEIGVAITQEDGSIEEIFRDEPIPDDGSTEEMFPDEPIPDDGSTKH